MNPLQRLLGYARPYRGRFAVALTAMAIYAAANALVGSLEKLGILKEITGYARNRRFRYDPYVKLFTDDVPEAGGAA